MLSAQKYRRPASLERVLRAAGAALVVAACLWGLTISGRAGASRLLSKYGMSAGDFTSASEAVRLTRYDPEARYALAAALLNAGELQQAISEFETAVSLRPRDYVLWLELGRVRDQSGDAEGALTAFKEATRLAPYYAQPRWQLGNLLLRLEQVDEAFSEFRQAVWSDPTMLPKVLDLAWAVHGGDTRAVQRAIDPHTAAARLELARFFARRGRADEAMVMFRGAGDVQGGPARELLADLLASKRFKDAYEVWLSLRGADKGLGRGGDAMTDGSFEQGISLDEPGFGWQIGQGVPAVRISLDKNNPRSGAHSLRIDWGGPTDPSSPVLSQLVPVEPGGRYRLSFAARVEELVTGGLPAVAAVDASDEAHMLSTLYLLPQGTSGWKEFSLEFTAAETTRAVNILVRRQDCAMTPCPIFGQIWFDDFVLRGPLGRAS